MPRLSAAAALALLYFCYSFLFGLGVGMAFNALMANISPWFPGHIGLSTGLMMMGFGLSSLLYALLIGRLTPRFSIFSLLRVFGAVIFAVVMLTSFVVRRPPGASKHEKGGGADSSSPTDMLRRPSFWVYFLWNIISGGAGMMIINNAANIFVFFGMMTGLSMIINVFNGCGRPFVGALVDRFGQFKSMFIMIIMLILASLCLILADRGAGVWLLFAGMVIVGIIYGGGSTINAKVIRDLYGPEHFGVNHSISNFCSIGGAVVGPLLSGILQDRSGGSFTGTFYTLGIMGILELLLFGLLVICVRRERQSRST